jgi:peptidoglycan/LPS O-acetylase OafA/YrhL
LYRGQYGIAKFGVFLVKRIVRLDPPYILSIIVALVLLKLSSLAPSYAGQGFSGTSVRQVLAHLGYLNTFVGYPWLNPVFWTLAIEFQYYLLIGLAFPLVSSSKLAIRMIATLLLAGSCLLVTSPAYLPKYLPLFLMGISAFQRRVGIIRSGEFFTIVALTIPLSLLVLGTPQTVAGGLSLTVIATVTFSNRILSFLGEISYSLYLVHVPFGGRIVNLGQRFATGQPARALVAFGAVGVSLSAAYCFYRVVEVPARKVCSAITYGPGRGTKPWTRSVTCGPLPSVSAIQGSESDASATCRVEG